MLEGEELRNLVLEILKSPSAKEMCSLRMELFMAAALSPNADACLVPFPFCFFDRVTKTKRLDHLRAKLTQVPKLSLMTKYANMEDEVWELLYWIFTNPLTIQPVPATEETLDYWSVQMKLRVPVDYLSRSFLYTVVNPMPKKGFLEGKAKHGSFHAFHGSKLENFHSVVHRGLIAALNQRSTYGVGSYLSNNFHISLGYSPGSPGWSNSEMGRPVVCIAICEIVDDPGITKQHFENSSHPDGGHYYYVVARDELIQLSHLIVITG